jgi:hypothetical protein
MRTLLLILLAVDGIACIALYYFSWSEPYLIGILAIPLSLIMWLPFFLVGRILLKKLGYEVKL